jgi:hypothetical protein
MLTLLSICYLERDFIHPQSVIKWDNCNFFLKNQVHKFTLLFCLCFAYFKALLIGAEKDFTQTPKKYLQKYFLVLP